jgi:large-conductance mechanosensitive channel
MNKLIAKSPPPEKPKLTIDQQLLTEIRDALKK